MGQFGKSSGGEIGDFYQFVSKVTAGFAFLTKQQATDNFLWNWKNFVAGFIFIIGHYLQD